MNIHNPEHRLKLAIDKLKTDKQVSQKNKNLILDFIDYLLAAGLSESRVMKYLYSLKQTSKLLKKDFTSINKKDATNFFKYINTNKDLA